MLFTLDLLHRDGAIKWIAELVGTRDDPHLGQQVALAEHGEEEVGAGWGQGSAEEPQRPGQPSHKSPLPQ